MKYRLLFFIHCPICGEKKFEVKSFVAEQINQPQTIPDFIRCKTECYFSEYVDGSKPYDCKRCFSLDIKEGFLRCKVCGAFFPIINFIPRMFIDKMKERVIKNYSDFFFKYKSSIPNGWLSVLKKPNSTTEKIKELTQRRFSYQWKEFSEMYKDYEKHFLSFIEPKVSSDFFHSKVGLDAGCGFGRHLFFATLWGSEMVGLDFSDAIDCAFQNCKHHIFTHFVQADIYNLPFDKERFDFIYSLGVLHHLPRPFDGFSKLVPLLKSNGAIFIWVFNKKSINIITFLLRVIFSWMPLNLLYFICYLIAIFEWVLILSPIRFLCRWEKMKKMFEKLPRHFLNYAFYPFRMTHADWFDRLSVPLRFYFSKEEIEEWYKKNGLKDIVVLASYDYGWKGYGVAKNIKIM